MSRRAQVLAFLGALGLHAVLFLFGGALFMKHDKTTVRENVELTEAVTEDEQDKKKTEEEKTEEKDEAEDEADQEAEEAIAEMREAAPDMTQLASLESPANYAALSAMSLSDLSSALSGLEAADGGFATGFSLASGGRIGGTGTATLDEESGAGGGAAGLLAIEDLDQRPRAVLQTPPTYPQELRKRKVEGSVEVVFLVDEAGRVNSPRVEKSSNPAFERPALDAVKQWRFEAGTRGGEKVAFKMRVPITFRAG